jgi:hypothetical protein
LKHDPKAAWDFPSPSNRKKRVLRARDLVEVGTKTVRISAGDNLPTSGIAGSANAARMKIRFTDALRQD